MEENSLMWKIVNLLWVIFSFIFILNGVGIIYAGYNVNNRNWLIEGIVYQAFPTALLILAAVNPNSSIGVPLAGIYILTWIVCIVRTFFIANKYLDYLRLKNNSRNRYDNQQIFSDNNQMTNNIPQPTINYQNQNNYHYNNTNFPIQDNNTDVINPANNTPPQDKESLFKDNSPESFNDSTETVTDNIQTVKINSASANEIAIIPGISLEQAKRIIELRNQGIIINSLDDLKQKLNLNDNQINQIKDYVEITNSNQIHRRIDL